MVNGPGTVIFTMRAVWRLRNSRSPTSTGWRLRMRPTMRGTGIVDIHAFERGGEPVRIAFAPDLPVGNDVQARLLLRPDRQEGGVVLRLRQVRLRDAPQLLRAHPGRKAPGELLAVDQPFGL